MPRSLRPSDAALVDPARIAGVATEEGGTDGHTAIILRALGIPSVLGRPRLGPRSHAANTTRARRRFDPASSRSGPHRNQHHRRHAGPSLAFARERQQLGRMRRLPAITLDGEAVDLQANLELPLELALVAQSGASGIGLAPHRIHVHEPRQRSGRGRAGSDLPQHHRDDGRRPRHDPRSRLGR